MCSRTEIWNFTRNYSHKIEPQYLFNSSKNLADVSATRNALLSQTQYESGM